MTDLATRLRDAASRIGFYDGKGQWEPGALSVIVEAADYIDNSVEATLRIRAEDRLAAAERALREIAEWSGPGDWTDLLKRMAREALPVAYSSEPQHTRWADLKAKRGLLSKEEREKRKTGPRLSDLNFSEHKEGE